MPIKNNLTRQEKARALRYKHGALRSLGAAFLYDRIYEIEEACADVRYYIEDESTLLDALDGDEDEAWEFKMMFADLSGDAANLRSAVDDWGFDEQDYDDVTVAMIGSHYEIIGYDAVEMDYFSLLNGWEQEASQEEARKRLMTKTKSDLLDTIQKSWCIFLAFFDLDQRYQHLKATMDILRGDNTALLAVIRDIEKKYEDIFSNRTESYHAIDRKAEREFDRMTEALPDRIWME